MSSKSYVFSSFVPSIPLLLIAFAVGLLDQIAKYCADAYLIPGQTVPLIKGIFHLTLVHNSGAAFGLFQGGTIFFIAISLVCVIGIVFIPKGPAGLAKFFGWDFEDVVVRLCLGLILGGAVGNLIDRLRFSYVVDFLDFRVWPVFNVADSAITVGGILLFIRIMKKTPRNNEE